MQHLPRHVIGVGASAGGVEALRALVADLPADLDAAVCIVLHIPPTGQQPAGPDPRPHEPAARPCWPSTATPLRARDVIYVAPGRPASADPRATSSSSAAARRRTACGPPPTRCSARSPRAWGAHGDRRRALRRARRRRGGRRGRGARRAGAWSSRSRRRARARDAVERDRGVAARRPSLPDRRARRARSAACSSRPDRGRHPSRPALTRRPPAPGPASGLHVPRVRRRAVGAARGRARPLPLPGRPRLLRGGDGRGPGQRRRGGAVGGAEGARGAQRAAASGSPTGCARPRRAPSTASGDGAREAGERAALDPPRARRSASRRGASAR